MLLQRIVPLILITLLVTAAVSHAQVTVSVRDTSARPADTLLIPVDLSGLVPGDEIFGVQATIKTGTPAVTILGIQTTGTLSDGASALYNTTTSKLAIAGTTPMTTNGVLVFLRVAVSGNPGNTYTLSVTGLQVNEGTPAATAENGSLYIRYVSIVPHSPSGVVLGDTIQFSVSGNVVQPLGWSTTAPSVGSIDANGKFIALAQGVVRVRVTDAEGKKDSTSAFAVNPTTLRSLTVSIPDTSQVQTIEIGLPIRVTDVTGLGITSAQFTLTYNASYLQYTGVSAAGTVSESWPAPIVNSTTQGTLNFALAGTTELTGAGTLIVARFLVKPASLSASQLNLSNVEFNEGIFAAIDNGIFTPLPAPVISPVPDRFTALMGETVPLVSTTGGTGPYAYSSSNTGVAQVDPVSGLLTVLTRGAVQVVATDAQGFPGSSDTIHTFDFVASLSESGVLVSDSVDVPLMVGNTTGLNISAFQFRVGYDTSAVQFRGVITSGGLADGYAVDARDTAGMVTVAGAGTGTLSGSGRLLSLRFLPNPNAVVGDSSTLALVQFQFNEPGPSTPAALPVSGVIRIADSNAPPVFTSVPADTTIDEGGSLTVSFGATDPDLDPLSYALLHGPSGASLDALSGDFTYSPSYADSGTYLVRVSVSDGFIADTAEFQLTVVNVNRSPVFSKTLPDTSIAEGQALGFQYTASDPDADPLRFFMVTAPSGTSIDSISGMFSWTPSFVQTGVHPIVIRVTDGAAADTVSSHITVSNVNRAPLFSTVLQSDTLLMGDTLRVTYQASDPDVDMVRYLFIQAPAGAQLDSVTGIFVWVTMPADTGTHLIRVIATDGSLADTTSAMIIVRPAGGPTSVAGFGAGVPDEYMLGQNYPNPFNPSTTIRFGMPVSGSVRLEVFNVLGQSVAVLHDGPLQAGSYTVEWRPTNASGLYVYRLEVVPSGGGTERFVQVKRMVLMK